MIASLIPRLDFSPVPRIEVRIGDDIVGGGEGDGFPVDDIFTDVFPGEPTSSVTVTIPGGTDAVTVWRIVDGLSYKVQGVVRRSWTGSLGVVDHGAPPNADSAYELECFASGSSLGRIPLGTTFLGSSLGPSKIIIQQPFNPNLHAVMTNMAGSWPEIGYGFPGEGVEVEGEGLPSFVGFGPMRTGTVEVDLEAEDRDTAKRLMAVFGTEQLPQIPVWLIRSPNPGLLPKVFYGRVVSLREIDITVGRSKGLGGGGVSRFRATLQQVKQPNPGVVVPALTYSDLVAALGATYPSITSTLTRYSEWSTAWEYSGAAG